MSISLRSVLVASALLLLLASSGCVSEEKYKKDVNAAYASGRSHGRAEGVEVERKAAEARIQKVTEEAQAEIQKITEASRSEEERLREQAKVERESAYVTGYSHASSGLALAVYEPLETSHGLMLVLLYCCVALLVIALGVAVFAVVSRAGAGRDGLVRVLPLVFSFYAWYRFIRPPGESYSLPNFRGAIGHSGLAELALIIVTLAACHAYVLLIKSGQRRLPVDCLAVLLAGVGALQLIEFGYNAGLLLQLSSPTFALRLALAPVIGGVAYALLHVGKVIAPNPEPEAGMNDEGGGKPRGRRLFQDA